MLYSQDPGQTPPDRPSQDLFSGLIDDIAVPSLHAGGSIGRDAVTGELVFKRDVPVSGPSAEALISSQVVLACRRLFEDPNQPTREGVKELLTVLESCNAPLSTSLARAERLRRQDQQRYDSQVAEKVLCTFIKRDPALSVSAMREYLEANPIPPLGFFRALEQSPVESSSLYSAALSLLTQEFSEPHDTVLEREQGDPQSLRTLEIARYLFSSDPFALQHAEHFLRLASGLNIELVESDYRFRVLGSGLRLTASQDPRELLSIVATSLASDDPATCAVALDLIAHYTQLPAWILPEVSRQLYSPSEVVRNRAIAALGPFGDTAQQFTEQVIQALDHEEESVVSGAILTLGQIGKPVERVVEVLVEQWELLRDLEDEPEFFVSDEGDVPSGDSFELEISTILREASLYIPRGYTGNRLFDPRLLLAPTLTSLALMLPHDKRAQRAFNEAVAHPSQIIRSALIEAFESAQEFEPIAPYLRKTLTSPTDLRRVVLLSFEHGQAGRLVVADYREELLALETFAPNETQEARYQAQREALDEAIAFAERAVEKTDNQHTESKRKQN